MGLGETETPFLKGRHTQASMCTGSQGKTETTWESMSDQTAVLEGSPGKTGGDCGALLEKDIGGKVLRNHQCVFL